MWDQGDFRARHPRFSGENFSLNRKIVDRLETLAAERGVTPAQLALAWVLHQGADIAPIPGTKRRTYLRENVTAAQIDLSAEDLALIDEAAARGVAAGERYADMSSIDA